MDANDADNLNTQIKHLYTNEHTISNTLSKQHTLNNQMLERLNNLTTHINNEQRTIETFITRNTHEISNRIQREENKLIEMQYLSQINYNIDLLNDHITNIAETIVLAKLNVISKLILNQAELNEIYNYMSNQSIEIISNEHLYELLELQAYYNNTNIIFNVKIPKLLKEKYYFYQRYKLPINGTKQIITQPYITYNDKSIQYYDKACSKIESIYFCKNPVYQEATRNSTCLGRILNNEEAQCNLNDTGKIESIFQPEENYIIFINVPNTLINSTCSKTSHEVTGTAILHYKNCSVEVNGITYKDNLNVFWDEVRIAPPTYASIQAKSITNTLNLQKLHLHQLQNHEAVWTLRNDTNHTNYITYITITIFGILVAAALLFLWKKRKTSYIIEVREDIAPAPSKSLWPSLYLKGGGVTQGHQADTAPPKPPRLTGY